MQTDILIIGGGPAAVVAAMTARTHNKDKKITLVRNVKQSVVPCGIPYIFNRLDSVTKNIMPDKGLESNHINTVISTVIDIDSDDKVAILKNNKKINYDKLILATGSIPGRINIEGSDKKGVFYVRKDLDYLSEMREAMLKADKIVIIGAGFIGLELAEEISSLDKDVHIIQRSGRSLTASFDPDFAELADKKLKDKGVHIHYNTQVDKIVGEKKVEKVILNNKKSLATDLVIFSIGAKPNITLAKKLNLKLGDNHAIDVDEYMRSSATDIFAIGDCAEKRDFFSGRYLPVMLASTATTEARIAAINLYELEDLRKNRGTLAVFSTYIDGLVLAVAGLTKTRATQENFAVIEASSECPNHHPGTLPNTEKIKVKLLFSKTSKMLMGAQIAGPTSISELINALAMAIQQEMTIYDFNTLQISTHPLLTSAPTVYPLITAAQKAMENL